MTKEVLLVLGIFEGRGWNPVNGHKAVIEAHLDSHKLTTGSFPLTNSPKFNTEITWEAEKQTIRRYKINRVPIKIECYSLDDKHNRKSLGYIVLPLTSAVEGVEADSKWHRVLGGPNAKFKNPPSILLRLHLEALGSNKPNQVACTPMTTFRNGQQAALEDIKMSFLQEKKNRLAPQQQQHRRDEVEVTRVSQTNGNAKGASRPDVVSHLLQGMNGVYTPKAHMDPDEMDEDMLEYDSEEEYDEDEDDGEIQKAYTRKERGPSAGNGPLRLEGGEVEAPLENGDAEMKDASLASGDASGQRDVSDHEALLKTRSDARELLRSISQTLRTSWQGGDSPRPGVSSAPLKSSSLTRRTQDISALLQDSLESIAKARKEEDIGASEGFSERLLASTERARPKESLEESHFRARLAQSPATTSAAFLLSQSLGDIGKARPSSAPDRNRAQTRLVAHLNTEEGYFSIGAQPGELEEQFNFSITIVYAKNLTKVIPEDVLSGLRGDYRFCYSLLGHSIHTDPFTDLNNPEFLAEKATAVIRSSHQTLSLYFTQHYFLPVHFLSEETCLGVCTIDILPLIEIATRDEAQVDGVYELEPAEGATPRAVQSDCKAMVAVSVHLSKTKSSAPAITQAPEQDNEIFLSDSMSSSSDEIDVFRVRSKRSKMAASGRPCVRCRSQGVKAGREMERKKKSLLHEAAYEVERWKEEQKKYYLKEWASKEETLQRLIAAEWSSKVKAIEGELSERLGECDKLQDKLNSALGELSVREEKIKVRERKVIEFEQELNCEKEKMMQSSGKLKESLSEKDPKHAQSQNLTKQFEAERKKRLELETEISKLQEELQISEQTVNAQTEEVFGLRRKLIQSDDIIGTGKEKNILLGKIESLQERKQYYKAQWLSAITDLHKLHSAHKNIIDEISCDDRRTNQDLPNPSSAGNKLRKLKDERKVLLESGLYPLNHSIIKRIDKKIKDLVG